jgi:iron complex outermembrane receptor protein
VSGFVNKNKPNALGMRQIALSIMLALSVPTGVTYAQTAPTQINIAAQPLANALVQLASQTSLELMYSPSIVAGLKAPAVAGNLTPDQALQQLLTNTNIQFKRQGNSVSLSRIAPPQAATELETISVLGSAGKVGGVQFNTPGSIEVADRIRLDEQQVHKVDEALQYQAGVLTELYGKDNKDNWFKVRGFDASMTLDGTPTTPNGFFVWVPEIYGVESVEIVKGANSFLYGSSEAGGVVNLITKRPKATPEGEINISLGTQNKRGISGDYSGFANEDGSVRYRLVGSVRQEAGTQHNTDMNHYYLAPSLTWDLSARTNLTLLASVQKDQGKPTNGFMPAYGSLIDTPYGKIDRSTSYGEKDADRYLRSQTSLGYEIQHTFDSGWKVSQNYRYSRLNLDWLGVFASWMQNDRLLNRGYSYSKGSTNMHAIDNRVGKTWQGERYTNTVLFGLDYLNSKTDGHNNGNGSAPQIDLFNPVYGQPFAVTATPYMTTTKQLGVYATNQFKWDNKWIVNAGIRRDKIKNDSLSAGAKTDYDVSHNSYNAGLMYVADNGVAPYISYSESFKPAAGSDATGAAYKPYEGRQYEVGVKYTPNWIDGTLSIAYFDLQEKNALVPDPSGISVQAGKRTNKGVELQADVNVTKQLSVLATYTHNNSRQDLKTFETIDTPMVPKDMASVWAKYKFTPALQAALGVRYTGSSSDQQYNKGYTLDSFTLLDAMVQYQLSNNWQLQVNARNLTDKTYVSACNFWCYYGPARSVEAQLSYRW